MRDLDCLLFQKCSQPFFTKLPAPPREPGLRLQPHTLDYGHGLHYDIFFNETNSDQKPIEWLCERLAPQRVVDLGGGSGRIAVPLVEAGFDVTLLEVHNPNFWQKTAGWKKGAWEAFDHSYRIDGKKHYLWERTFPGAYDDHVIWEHAVTRNLWRFTLLRTEIQILNPEHWEALARQGGWRWWVRGGIGTLSRL